MFYRENGQFKTSYQADQQIFPIRQDRVLVLAFIAFIFVYIFSFLFFFLLLYNFL